MEQGVQLAEEGGFAEAGRGGRELKLRFSDEKEGIYFKQ